MRAPDINASFSRAWSAFKINGAALVGAGFLVGLVTLFTLFIGAAPMVVGYKRLALRAVRGEVVKAG
jgi:hypothetical protein